MSSKNRKAECNSTPIENRSLFSVKKRAPNPQVPEPRASYSRKKTNARVFLCPSFIKIFWAPGLRTSFFLAPIFLLDFGEPLTEQDVDLFSDPVKGSPLREMNPGFALLSWKGILSSASAQMAALEKSGTLDGKQYGN
jgi:hypothetical protein